MAYDFLAVNEDREPVQLPNHGVELGLEVHHKLFSDIDHRNYPLLSRMHDYYSDVIYRDQELGDLAKELRALAESHNMAPYRPTLLRMAELTSTAQAAGLGIEAIAD